MAIEFREIHIPAMIIAVIIGYELTFYFLRQYYKSKDEKLELNKILLAFGLFFGFLLTGVLIRTINNYYVEDIFLTEVLEKLTVAMVLLSVIMFLFFISSKGFHEIMVPLLTKIIINHI